MCDLAFTLLLDRLDAVAVAALSAGAEVDPDEELERFTTQLHAEDRPAQVGSGDPDRDAKLRALGLR